jgi:hypothetical protein
MPHHRFPKTCWFSAGVRGYRRRMAADSAGPNDEPADRHDVEPGDPRSDDGRESDADTHPDDHAVGHGGT